MVKLLNSFFEARSTLQMILIGLILVSLIGMCDFLTGNELSFSIFYLFPVALASWYSDLLTRLGVERRLPEAFRERSAADLEAVS